MCMFRQVCRDIKEFTTSFIVIVSGTANSISIESKQGELAKKEKSRHSPTSLCTTCGRLAHDRGPCPDASNKYANKTNTPYVGSTAHALLVKETGNKNWIPNSNYNRPDKCKPATPASAPTGAPGKKPFEKKKDWTDTRRDLLYALSPPSSSQTPDLLMVSLSSLSKETSGGLPVYRHFRWRLYLGEGCQEASIHPNSDGFEVYCLFWPW